MNLNVVVYPILSLGGLGLLFGAGLAFAAKKFEVEVDERMAAIRDEIGRAHV